VITRADAVFGYGHLARTVTLARYLRNKRSFNVSILLLGDVNSLKHISIYEEKVEFFPSWELKWAIRRGILRELLMHQFSNPPPQVVIFDMYNFFDTFWARGLFKKIFPASAFVGLDVYRKNDTSSDTRKRFYKPVELNLVVNSLLAPFGGFEVERNGVRTFIGTKFLVLPDFIHSLSRWKADEENKEVMVFLGGGSIPALRWTIAEIANFALKPYRFTVFTSEHELIAKFAPDGVQVQPLVSQHEFLEAVCKAKFCIISAGQTLYELAYLGVPCIVIPVKMHQLSTAQKFAEKGFSITVPPSRARLGKLLFSAIMQFSDTSVLSKHSKIGRSLIDGKGLYRVSDLIEQLAEKFSARH